MTRQDHITGPAFLLVVGRTAGLIATFAIGPLFARLFSVEDNGTYATVLLVLFPTLFGLAQLGMAESLYYFLPLASRDHAAHHVPRYVCNAAITLALLGAVCAAGLWAGRHAIAGYFGNPALAAAMPLLGLFVAFMLVGAVFEITMVSRKQHGRAALAYGLSDVARTALFVTPALLFVSVQAVFAGAALFAGLRLLAMLVVLWRQFGREFRPDLALWRSQLAYALPFALAVGLEVVLAQYHQYVVGGRFDIETFAIYLRGCLTIPLVDLIMTSTTSVMMVKMAEVSTDRDEALALYHDTVSRLVFLLCPLTVALVVLAEPFILALLTDKFAASVPIFMIWSLTIVPVMFGVDAVLRAFAERRALVLMNVARLAVVVSLIGWFLDAFSLAGAVLATLTAMAVSKALGLVRVAHVLGVPMGAVLPWRTLGRITLRALAAGVPAWWLAQVFGGTPWLAFISGGAAYGVTYLVLCYAPGIAEPAAIRLPIGQRFRQLPIVRRALASS